MKICKTKKSKIIVLSLLIGIIAIIGGTATYAFWKITKTQANANDIVSSCLNISFQTAEGSSGVNLLNEMPITDEEAQDYDGYEFIIKNHCDDPVEFYLAAKKITDDEDSIKNSSISMSISTANDDDIISSDFKSLSNVDEDDDSTKIVRYDTLAGKEEKTYTYKMWINETSDIEDESKEFETKLIATAGQGVVDESRATYAEGCYIINGLGTIDGYRVEENDLDGNPCVWTSAQVAASDYAGAAVKYIADVTIPEKVAGIKVETIDKRSMTPIDESTYIVIKYVIDKDNNDYVYVVSNKDDGVYDAYAKLMGYNSLEEFAQAKGTTAEYVKGIIDSNILSEYNGPYEYTEEYTLEELVGDVDYLPLIINSLDLSRAIYLTNIKEAGFQYYIGSNDNLDIPDNVKTIGDFAFISYGGKSLTLHEGLESIGNYAFADDTYGAYGSINDSYGFVGENSQLIIPNSVKSIGALAFYSFNGSYLDLGDGIKSLGAQAFRHYEGVGMTLTIPSSLTTLTSYKTYDSSHFSYFKGTELIIENGIKEIKNNMFSSYIGTDKDLIIPDSVQSIGSGAFLNYNGQSISFGKNIKSIGREAFNKYVGTNLALSMPKALETIGYRTFWSYNGSKLTLNDNLKSISSESFYNYKGKNVELVIPNSVIEIGVEGDSGGTFYNYNGTNLVLGNSLKTIGELVFGRYVGLGKELVIPSSVEEIKDLAFYHYNGSRLVLNEGLKTIGWQVFSINVSICKNLPETQELINETGIEVDFGSDTCVSVFLGYIGKNQTLTIPNSVQTIGSSSFASFNGSNIVIGTGLTELATSVFKKFEGVGSSLVIPNNIESIKFSAFYSYNGADLKLSENLNYIEEYAFRAYTNNIRVNRTEPVWNAAISNGSLVLGNSWKNDNATLVFN